MYVGDGTGYSFIFSKRASSITTDMVTINEISSNVISIAGNANATNFLGNLIGNIVNGNSNIIVNSNANITMATNGSERVRITTGGAVGIGTTNPARMLDVNATGDVDGIKVKGGVAAGAHSSLFTNNLDGDNGINFTIYGNAYAAGSYFNVGANGSVIVANTSSPFAIGTGPVTSQPLLLGSNGISRLQVEGNGQVTINTPTAGNALVANGNVIANYYYGNGINLTGIVKAIQFFPASATYPSANFATYQSVSGTNFPVNSLAFDANTEESVFFNFNSDEYRSGNVLVDIQWYANTATSGNIVWGASIACITPNSDTQDITTKAFGAETLMLDTHLGTTGKRLHSISANLSNVDGIATSDWCVLKIARKAANVSDTMTGDALVVAVDVTYIN
jgi:hypothetical protein